MNRLKEILAEYEIGFVTHGKDVDAHLAKFEQAILAWVEKDVIGADYYFNDDAFPTGAEKIRLEERNKLLAMQRKRARL